MILDVLPRRGQFRCKPILLTLRRRKLTREGGSVIGTGPKFGQLSIPVGKLPLQFVHTAAERSIFFSRGFQFVSQSVTLSLKSRQTVRHFFRRIGCCRLGRGWATTP